VDDRQGKFVKNLLHSTINMLIFRIISRFPTWMVIVLLAAALGAVWYFNLY
jgi:hypothetical protein